jgi:hypothetical protein
VSVHTPAELRAIRGARKSRESRDLEECGRCGYARLNVRHETDREHAPEGLEYYADVPFCEFKPSGRRVRP